MYIHIFFIHSSVDRHLVCFPVLTIVDSAAVDIGVHVSFRSLFSSDIYPQVGLLYLIVAIILVFTVLVVYQFTFPPTV